MSLTKPEDIACEFHKNCVNISSMILSTIKFSKQKLHDFLPDIDINSFFIKPVDKSEIQNTIVSQCSEGCWP